MPLLTARSTVATGVLVSQTQSARESVDEDAVVVTVAVLVAAEAPGARTRLAAATAERAAARPARRLRRERPLGVRGRMC
ncbi:hypothetical protein GCM10023258_36480 [Terrabacter aeriphilus]|uniref:Secreted protein n=1 Tax=Terrabacter aeriphilus TaxID=515662 RepID=A0ABP9JL54_9MICO